MKLVHVYEQEHSRGSLPLRECGLKSGDVVESAVAQCVTPLAGVWVEMKKAHGLSYILEVTPLAGVWVEMPTTCASFAQQCVTPLAGVWVEIAYVSEYVYREPLSLPSRECGLK